MARSARAATLAVVASAGLAFVGLTPALAQQQSAPPQQAPPPAAQPQGQAAQPSAARPQAAQTQGAKPQTTQPGQQPAAELPPPGPPNAEQVLLEKANFWRLKDRPDLAAEALNQVLAIDPNNPDALFQYGMLSMQQNKPADAQRYLAKLQQVSPNDSHIADLQSAIRTGKIGSSDINEARRLAQSGQTEEAVQKYKEIFRGPPPPGYGVEYYMTLAGTPEGWDEARQGMERLVQASPNDPQLRLSLGEIYTYREQTRKQGIAILVQLSKNPIVGAQAVQAWKQTLSWLGGAPYARQAFQQYLAQYPNDTDVQQLLADLKNQPAGEGGSQGYVDLKRGRLAEAEKEFRAELRANPNDAQALAGMGLLRQRQQRFGEARDYLERALKQAPEQRRSIGPALDSVIFWGRVDEAKRAAAAKNYAQARAILGPLLAHPRGDEWGALMVLGDIETKAGQAAAAEGTYREVLRLRPGNPDAQMGLANALQAQNKTAELDQMKSRMGPAERARFEKAMASGGGGPAVKLREEAKAASANGDNATADAKFQQAIALDPREPWIRLDYARFLAGENNMQKAYAVVDPRASGDTPISIMVAAMFDVQQDHWVRALDLINSIPPAQRTEDIKNFRDRIYVRGTIERAKQMAKSGDIAGAKAVLVRLYTDPEVQTDEKRQAPFVIMKDLNDPDTAIEITRAVYAKGGPQSVKAGADYAMLLMLKGGHDDEAAQVLAQITASGLVNSSNREDLTPVYITLAVREADKLRDRGDYAGAWDKISQYLNDNPDNTDLLLCAGRIYASGGRSTEAMEEFKKAYDQDSDNMQVLRGVISGAILAHEYSAANDYIKKGMQADPQNPWLYYLQAQVDQAEGLNGAAIEALRQARTLNLQQNPDQATSATTQGAPTPLTPGVSPATLPPNPFRRSQAILPTQLTAVTL
ncbi:MAG TPA: tetratricopeptide repeat protein [Stellaceae bacterium]|nr:tetratricopeptide repeat protein [Stellaceae bacterium]